MLLELPFLLGLTQLTPERFNPTVRVNPNNRQSYRVNPTGLYMHINICIYIYIYIYINPIVPQVNNGMPIGASLYDEFI